MSTIAEHKKEVITDYLQKLEDQISQMYHTMENDSEISNDNFKVYEKMIEQLNYIHSQLLDEIIFS